MDEWMDNGKKDEREGVEIRVAKGRELSGNFHGKLSPVMLLKFIKKKLAYNSEPFLWNTHTAILGLVAYFG